jgi:hypothetical protein
LLSHLIQHLVDYLKLSEQVQKLNNPQRSDAFLKRFQQAVREGKIEAVTLAGVHFELPKQFKRSGTGGGTYYKSAREMLFEATPEFAAWFAEINAQLGEDKQPQPQVSLETIESGAVDFQVLAAATRQRIQASYLKGQQVGRIQQLKSRGRGRK